MIGEFQRSLFSADPCDELGIFPGDIVTTSYGTGPYVVRAVKKVQQTFSLTMDLAGTEASRLTSDQKGFYINEVQRVGDRWLAHLQWERPDEIFVHKGAKI